MLPGSGVGVGDIVADDIVAMEGGVHEGLLPTSAVKHEWETDLITSPPMLVLNESLVGGKLSPETGPKVLSSS